MRENMYELQIISAEDGGRVPLPAGTTQYTVLSETNEEGEAQIAVLVEKEPQRGIA